eukprot:Blabericola_migrator_1__3854@NODE_2160_length_3186_cov_3_593139_g1365_i0_p2_GENE_NODE_2160_length_3186_cov_3_593139_g1365_i0NODE_2160_length_3186_cov_3_593139_g1365_i0_p2_ORF_typecomplete_len104_score1_09_NODE_2160_length_3186_cov_3_593139_g1365_i023562667
MARFYEDIESPLTRALPRVCSSNSRTSQDRQVNLILSIGGVDGDCCSVLSHHSSKRDIVFAEKHNAMALTLKGCDLSLISGELVKRSAFGAESICGVAGKLSS